MRQEWPEAAGTNLTFRIHFPTNPTANDRLRFDATPVLFKNPDAETRDPIACAPPATRRSRRPGPREIRRKQRVQGRVDARLARHQTVTQHPFEARARSLRGATARTVLEPYAHRHSDQAELVHAERRHCTDRRRRHSAAARGTTHPVARFGLALAIEQDVVQSHAAEQASIRRLDRSPSETRCAPATCARPRRTSARRPRGRSARDTRASSAPAPRRTPAPRRGIRPARAAVGGVSGRSSIGTRSGPQPSVGATRHRSPRPSGPPRPCGSHGTPSRSARRAAAPCAVSAISPIPPGVVAITAVDQCSPGAMRQQRNRTQRRQEVARA